MWIDSIIFINIQQQVLNYPHIKYITSSLGANNPIM